MFTRMITFAALAIFSSSAHAEEPLSRLIDEARSKSPEVAQARAELEAERARIPQASAPADPTLTLGIQNDGFRRIEIGTMETSFINIMLTQPLFWPGKRGFREQIAALGARRAEARLSRALLDVEGRVRRAWTALLLLRGQTELLEAQQRLWAQAEQTARSRYESGQVPQSDLLRAQLERARLVQRQWALEAEFASKVAELNRLRARRPDEPWPAAGRLADLPDPAVLPEAEAQRDAEARSPELSAARAAVDESERRVALARRERFPDFAITAAVMPRGSLEPMWQLGVSIGVPIFAARKQNRAVDESEERRVGADQGAEAIAQIVRLRASQRRTVLSALNRVNQQYRTQVLVLSEATARSTLAQYAVGRVPFATVLEAISGYIADRATFLASLSEAQLVAIAEREVSLEPVAAMSTPAGDVSMPGTAMSRSSPGTSMTSSAPPPAATQNRAMNGM
ncbi:MAG TPA: TolC family protein [Myxococcales bacterium]|jgi:outer membrane protein TolC|nr:TolC family protein [Myxococcales bacterium]